MTATIVQRALDVALQHDDWHAYGCLASTLLAAVVTPPTTTTTTTVSDFNACLQRTLRDAEQQQRAACALFMHAFVRRRVGCLAWLIERTSLQLRAIDVAQRLVAAACAFGDAALCRLLLQHGCDVNARNLHDGATPLIVAVRAGNREIVNLLLARHDTDVHASTFAGETALDCAHVNRLDDVAHALQIACAQMRPRPSDDTRDDAAAVRGCIYAALAHGSAR